MSRSAWKWRSSARAASIKVERVVCAHDCGQIINPDGVRAQVEGSILQTLSRVLMEEVKFDRSRVTSVDWASYPILTFSEVPKIEIDLIDRPTEPPLGAGEAACAPVGGGARQRGVRRDRRAAAHDSVHAGAREGGARADGRADARLAIKDLIAGRSDAFGRRSSQARLRGACRRAGGDVRVSAPPRACRRLSVPSDHADRAVPAGRRRRHHRARDGAEALHRARPADRDREPSRSGRRDRHARGRQGRAGRLHAGDDFDRLHAAGEHRLRNRRTSRRSERSPRRRSW